MVLVTYDDALAFCKWLSTKVGAPVRLPTEAEWEYAAMGGHEGALYPWGVERPKTKARYNGNAPSGVKTAAKQAFPPNDFGLYNMSGNVAEWVLDYYGEHYYQTAPLKNPPGPGASKERVVRGGSWHTGEAELQCARRGRLNPAEGKDDVGFRVLVQIDPQKPH